MLAASIPAKFPVPWASSAAAGFTRAIPTTPTAQAGAASLQLGFPPLTFTDVSAGGVFPFGEDENGILNQITAWSQWQNAGATVGYDSVFSTAIGGYPSGAILYAAAGNAWWLSTADNNTSDPDTGGANWQLITDGLTYAGNPNSHVAGVSPVNGFLTNSILWDSTNKLLWLCTTTGNAAGAVWTQITSSAAYGTFWCGTSTGTANAQTIITPLSLQAFPTGTEIRWKAGAGLTNTGAITLTVGTFGTFGLLKDSPTGPIALTGSPHEVVAGNILTATYDGTYLQLTSVAAGTASLANASSNTGTVAAVSGATIVAYLPAFSDTTGTLINGPALSSNTGTVAAVSGATIVAHLPAFSDTTGTLINGPALSSNQPIVVAVSGATTIGDFPIFSDTTGTLQDSGLNAVTANFNPALYMLGFLL